MPMPTTTLETRAIDGHERAVVRETIEVPYDANDLENRHREELVAMVQRQSEKWPYHDGKRRFTTKTNIDRMRGVLLNRAFGFTKEVEVIRPLSPPPPPPPPPPPSRQPEPQHGVEPQESGDEEEPARSLGSGRASPGVQSEEEKGGDSDGDWDTEAHENVETDVYVSFVSPNAEEQRNVYTLEVARVGWGDALYEWQADTQQLIDRLAMRAPQVAGATEISYADPVHPEYTRRLKAATPGRRRAQPLARRAARHPHALWMTVQC